MQGFLEALDARVLVCDGATGTMLYAKGIFLNRSFDHLNLTHPELVADVHREYVSAGADVVETNTFGANRVKLTHFDLANEVIAINREGAALARRVASGRAWVAGSIGPLGVRIAPWGRTSVAAAQAAFAEQAEALADGGVDLFMFETFGDVNELVAAIRGARGVSTLPIVAQLTTGDDGHTADGTPPERFMPILQEAGADVVGVNCSVGPAAMLETIERMASGSSARLAAQPNAGRPRDVDGRNLYLSSPEYMATYARRFVAAGVRLIGGCCGTTPEHTRLMAQAVGAAVPATRVVRRSAARAEAPAPMPVPREEKSSLAHALARRSFVVVAEIAPPRGLDVTVVARQSQRFREAGAVAVSVPDYPRSGARANAQALAAIVEQAGTETILHCTCRDRTLVEIQSDLVGMHAMGIRNVLVTTGSPSPSGNFPEAISRFEVDAIGVVQLVSRLNGGVDLSGQPLGAVTSFHAGVAINPFPADADSEWDRLARKIDAGAEFVVTPPILDVQAFEPVLNRLRAAGLPVLCGVAALEGARHAEFLSSEVVGVRASDDLLDRLRGAGDDRAEADRVTTEIVEWLRPRCDGLVLSWLHGSTETVERRLQQTVGLVHG